MRKIDELKLAALEQVASTIEISIINDIIYGQKATYFTTKDEDFSISVKNMLEANGYTVTSFFYGKNKPIYYRLEISL